MFLTFASRTLWFTSRQHVRTGMCVDMCPEMRRACVARSWNALIEAVLKSTSLSVPLHWTYQTTREDFEKKHKCRDTAVLIAAAHPLHGMPIALNHCETLSIRNLRTKNRKLVPSNLHEHAHTHMRGNMSTPMIVQMSRQMSHNRACVHFHHRFFAKIGDYIICVQDAVVFIESMFFRLK